MYFFLLISFILFFSDSISAKNANSSPSILEFHIDQKQYKQQSAGDDSQRKFRDYISGAAWQAGDQLFNQSLGKLHDTHLNELVTSILHSWSAKQWQTYLEQFFGNFAHANSPHDYDAVFELYNFYQFAGFRDVIEKLPGYKQAINRLADKLDPIHPNNDQQLCNNLKDYTVGNEPLNLYFSRAAIDSGALQTHIGEFKAHFVTLAPDEQTQAVSTLRQYCAFADTQVRQQENALKGAIKSSRRDELTKLNYIAKERLASAQEMVRFAQEKMQNWPDKYLKELVGLNISELMHVHDALQCKVHAIRQDITTKYTPAIKRAVQHQDSTQNHAAKMQVQSTLVRSAVLDHGFACDYHYTLKQSLQCIQNVLYTKQASNSQYFNERLHALKQSSDHVKAECQQEMADLKKRVEQIHPKYGFNNYYASIITSTSALADVGTKAIHKNDALLTWLASDIGNSMLDFVTTHADTFPQAAQQDAFAKNLGDAISTIVDHGSELVGGVGDCLQNVAHIAKRVVDIAEQRLINQPISQSIEDLGCCLISLKDSLLDAGYTGDFKELHSLVMEQYPAAMPAIERMISHLQGCFNNQEIETMLAYGFRANMHVAGWIDQAAKRSSSDWARWLGNQAASWYVCGTLIDKTQTLCSTANDAFIASQQLFEKPLAQRIIIEAEIVEVELAGCQATHALKNEVGKEAENAVSTVVQKNEVAKNNANQLAIAQYGKPSKLMPTKDELLSCWSMPESGCTIMGRYYTKHALERMAPDTPEVRAILERRALEKGFKVGSTDYLDYVQPRNIPPMVIEDAINTVQPIIGKKPNTLEYITDSVKVVVNHQGDVITIYRR